MSGKHDNVVCAGCNKKGAEFCDDERDSISNDRSYSAARNMFVCMSCYARLVMRGADIGDAEQLIDYALYYLNKNTLRKRQEQIESAFILMATDIDEHGNKPAQMYAIYNPDDYDYYFGYYGKNVKLITIEGINIILQANKKHVRGGVLITAENKGGELI